MRIGGFRGIWLCILGMYSRYHHPILKKRDNMSHLPESTSSVGWENETPKSFVNSSLKFYEMRNYAKFDRNRAKFEENTTKIERVLSLLSLER